MTSNQTKLSYNETLKAQTVSRPNIPNLSMYSGWMLKPMVEMVMKLLYYTEETTVISHIADYDRLAADVLVEIPNETTAKSMVDIANFLVHFELRHEAIYFYHAAINICDSLRLRPCKIEHDSLLQITKMVNAGKLRLDPGTRVEESLYSDMLRYLMEIYESREAALLF